MRCGLASSRKEVSEKDDLGATRERRKQRLATFSFTARGQTGRAMNLGRKRCPWRIINSS